MLIGKRVGAGLTRSSINPMLPCSFQIREQATNICMVLNPLWLELCFVLDGNPADRDKCEDNNVATIACGRWSLVTD